MLALQNHIIVLESDLSALSQSFINAVEIPVVFIRTFIKLTCSHYRSMSAWSWVLLKLSDLKIKTSINRGDKMF